MRHNPSDSRALRYTALATLAAAMVGCGGGGSSSTSANIDLTAANRDAASHAAAASVLALSTATAVPLLGSGAAAAQGTGTSALRAAAAASPAGGWTGRLMQLIQVLPQSPGSAAGTRMQAQAVSGPVVEPCLVSGSVAVTVDDKDNSGTPTAGDVLDIVFSACKDSEFETLNGGVSVTYTQITQSPTPSVRARLVLQQLSDAAANHALTLDGAVLLDYSVAASAVETLILTADGPIVAGITTHVFTDTVTLARGFREQAVYDPSAEPPVGSAQFGRTVSTVSGLLSSTALGGRVEVATLESAPLVQYAAEPYPRSGSVQIDGRRGRILVTALSAGETRLELDAGNDGSYESGSTVSWDWLL